MESPLLSDCPIQPHVFREFGDSSAEQLELIAHVRPGVSVTIVASTLRNWLPTEDTESNSLFAYDQYLLVETDFESVITALLPLTGWSDFLRRAARLTSSELEIELSFVRSSEQRRSRRQTTRDQASARLSYEDHGRLRWLLTQIVSARPDMSAPQVLGLIHTAVERAPRGAAPLLSVGFNRWADPAVNETRKTIKADAAQTLFELDCSDLTWAVVDTGIDVTHPMITPPGDPADGDERGGAAWHARSRRSRVTRIFDIPAAVAALRKTAPGVRFAGIVTDSDWETFLEAAEIIEVPGPLPEARFNVATNDHGTHVAGILAGTHLAQENLPTPWLDEMSDDAPVDLMGICPSLRLIDVRVFDEHGSSREFEVVIALAFLNWLNRQPDTRIDGINISLSIPFAVDNFACGWTSVCIECDRLVAGGVVVVCAAGNSGYDDTRGTLSVGGGFQLLSISDPGNADRVITVGATHRTDPHKFGPISRSARGPTADGRHKPDLLAPGDQVWGPVPGGGWGRKSGTSQAAPHVSAVAAMLLARYSELRGRPTRVKTLLCDSATDLGRLIDFQGHGLVDALRALQRP